MIYHFVLLLPCFVCLFWAITLFCKRKTNLQSQNLWIVTALLMCISTYIWSVHFSGIRNYAVLYKIEVVKEFTNLLLVPMFFFCFKSLSTGKALSWKECIWLLPALIVGISLSLLYMAMGEKQAIAYICEVLKNKGRIITFADPVCRLHYQISVHLYKLLVLIQIILLLIYATIRTIYYRKRLKIFFSNPNGKSRKNHLAMLAGFYLILFLSLITYVEHYFYNGNSKFVVLIMILWSIVIYFMGYHVYNVKHTADEVIRELKVSDEVPEQRSVSLSGDSCRLIKAKKKQTELLDSFQKTILEEKIFLQKNLHLSDVARMLHTNRTYISRMFNEEYRCSFSDFINSKRIEYAQELMRSNPTMTQEEIADLSGFLHNSSFSRTFKQQVGLTFKEWQKRSLIS